MLTLKALVLDDHPYSVFASIQASLGPIAPTRDLTQAPDRVTWKIVLTDLSFIVECDFFQQTLADARALFFEAGRLDQYHLVLLDNDWENAGGDSGGFDGLRLLKETFTAGIRHPY